MIPAAKTPSVYPKITESNADASPDTKETRTLSATKSSAVDPTEIAHRAKPASTAAAVPLVAVATTPSAKFSTINRPVSAHQDTKEIRQPDVNHPPTLVTLTPAVCTPNAKSIKGALFASALKV